MTVVYVASALGNHILAFALDGTSGRLERLQRLDVAGGVAPLALAPNHRLMYGLVRSSVPAVATFTIASDTGKLTLLATTPVTSQYVYLHVDRSGRYLLAASYTGAFFSIHTIDENGMVVETPTQLTTTPPYTHCAITDPSNRNLFVTSLGGDIIMQYAFDETTGHATPNKTPFIATTKGSGPRHLIFHPRIDVAYVNAELDGSIAVYQFDHEDGCLAFRQRVETTPPGSKDAPWAADLHITPDGRYLYASDRRTSTLALFAADDSGLLERRGIIATEMQPRSFAIDPSGKFLFVAGEKSQRLTTYAIDASTGELHALGHERVGEKPAWVSIAQLPS